ncbi:hypothetical protein [Proteus mirabilis]
MSTFWASAMGLLPAKRKDNNLTLSATAPVQQKTKRGLEYPVGHASLQ